MQNGYLLIEIETEWTSITVFKACIKKLIIDKQYQPETEAQSKEWKYINSGITSRKAYGISILGWRKYTLCERAMKGKRPKIAKKGVASPA